MFEVSYLMWAFGLSSVVYAAMRLPAEHLNPKIHDTVALWLNEQDTKLWAKHFSTLFDRVMGEQSFSAQRILRSLIATALSVVFLWTLFSPVLGLMEERFDEPMSLWDLLLLGFTINAVADYLSLIQTRWVLSGFQRQESALLHVIFFVFDLLASVAIIVLMIGVYRLIDGERPLTVVELTAGYTPYSVLFYSTLLSSAWAWVFVLSSMTIKVFSQLGLARLLDTWNKPFAQIALFSSIIVFVILIGARPILGQYERQELDEWICNNFGGYSCTHAARLSDDDIQQLRLLEIACQTGDDRQCASSFAAIEPDLANRAISYWESQCLDGQNGEACWVAGKMLRHARGVMQDFSAANIMFELGCNLGNLDACTDLGEMNVIGLGADVDFDTALTIFENACSAGNARSCHNLGGMYEYGAGVGQDFLKANEIYSCGCLDGDGQACTSLSRLYFTGSGVEESRSKAGAILQRVAELTRGSCKQHETGSCTELEFVVCQR